MTIASWPVIGIRSALVAAGIVAWYATQAVLGKRVPKVDHEVPLTDGIHLLTARMHARYATNVAAQMVGAVGMTDTLISYGAVQGSALSDTNLVGRVLGDPEGRVRVEDILQQAKQRAHSLLEANMHLVEALRDALLERHELIGPEITDVLEAALRVGPGTPVPLPPEVSIDLRDQVRATQG